MAMEACNAALEACNAALEACNAARAALHASSGTLHAALEACNVALEACNAAPEACNAALEACNVATSAFRSSITLHRPVAAGVPSSWCPRATSSEADNGAALRAQFACVVFPLHTRLVGLWWVDLSH